MRWRLLSGSVYLYFAARLGSLAVRSRSQIAEANSFLRRRMHASLQETSANFIWPSIYRDDAVSSILWKLISLCEPLLLILPLRSRFHVSTTVIDDEAARASRVQSLAKVSKRFTLRYRSLTFAVLVLSREISHFLQIILVPFLFFSIYLSRCILYFTFYFIIFYFIFYIFPIPLIYFCSIPTFFYFLFISVYFIFYEDFLRFLANFLFLLPRELFIFIEYYLLFNYRILFII